MGVTSDRLPASTRVQEPIEEPEPQRGDRPVEPGSTRHRPAPTRHRRGGVPVAVAWLTVLFVAGSACYALLFPTYRAPDEPRHVDLVRAMQLGEAYPEYDQRTVSDQVQNSLAYVGVQIIVYSVMTPPEWPAPARTERPSFGALGTGEPTDFVNQLANHPPTYYLVTGGLLDAAIGVYAPVEDWPFDRVVLLLRLLSVLTIAPIPLLAFLTARRLTGSREAGLVAAVLPLTVPQLLHVGSSVSNDPLLILEVGVVTYLLSRVLTGDHRVRTAVGIGVVCGIAYLTKGLALPLAGFVSLAYGLAWYRTRSWTTARVGLVALGVGAVLGGWWWIRNLVLYGTLQPTAANVPVSTDDPLSVVFWLTRSLRSLVLQFSGLSDISTLPAGLSALPVALGVIAVAVGLVAATARRRRRAPTVSDSAAPDRVAISATTSTTTDAGEAAVRSRIPVADLAVLLYPVVAPAVLVLQSTYGWFVRTNVILGANGRYLLPGIVALSALVGLGLFRAFGSRPRVLLVTLVALVGVIHAVYASSSLLSWWGPIGGSLAERVRSMVSWAPLPTAMTLTLFAVTGLLLLLAAVAVGRSARPAAAQR